MGLFVHKKFLCSIKSNTSEGKREPGAQGWARSLVLDTDASMLWLILLGAWVTLQKHSSLLTEAGSQALWLLHRPIRASSLQSVPGQPLGN